MDPIKIGKLITNLRKKNNLTQQELADKLNVTYQAVSKWENGKSIPDVSLLQKISELFNIDINCLLNGVEKTNKKNCKILFIIPITVILVIFIVLMINNNEPFEFKPLTTDNDKFTIDGVAAYSKDKQAIYISNINYNDKDDNEYKVLECTLYEKNGNVETKISKCGDITSYEGEDTKTLKELLNEVSFNVDNVSHSCETLKAEDLHLKINALDKNDKTITYDIKLKLNDTCSN